MEGFLGGHKRSRKETECPPDSKRFHADILLSILAEDESDSGECNPADQDLGTVIRSLEEEIGVSTDVISSGIEAAMGEIEYLQEASDDELGIPPPEMAGSPGGDDREDEASEGFGRMWLFEDEGFPAWYESFVEVGSLTEEHGGEVANGYCGYFFDEGIVD